MALGGLLETLVTPEPVDTGWGSILQLDTRAWVVVLGVVAGAQVPTVGASDPVVATATAYVGRMVGGNFKPWPDAAPAQAVFTRGELKAMSGITLAEIIAAAKVKLAL